MAQLLNFFPKVYAQSAGPDAISQPTFGTINVSGSGTQNSTILLKSTSTSSTVGERFKVRIEIKTNTVAVSEYRVVVDFDPTRLQVVDQDTSTSGNQIRNLDTIFVAQNPQTDNTVTTAGRITFVGKTADGNPLSINREVLEIEFQSQTVGSSPIRVVTGASGSQLIRQNGSGVSFTGNEVSVQIAAASSGNGGGTTNPPPVSGGGNGTGSTPPPTLPDTALEAGVGDLLAVVLGIMVIGLGTKMTMSRKKNEFKER